MRRRGRRRSRGSSSRPPSSSQVASSPSRSATTTRSGRCSAIASRTTCCGGSGFTSTSDASAGAAWATASPTARASARALPSSFVSHCSRDCFDRRHDDVSSSSDRDDAREGLRVELRAGDDDDARHSRCTRGRGPQKRFARLPAAGIGSPWLGAVGGGDSARSASDTWTASGDEIRDEEQLERIQRSRDPASVARGLDLAEPESADPGNRVRRRRAEAVPLPRELPRRPGSSEVRPACSTSRRPCPTCARRRRATCATRPASGTGRVPSRSVS